MSSSSSSTKAETSFSGETLAQSFENNCEIGAPSLEHCDQSCSVCYNICHARASCPYFKDLPNGANFNRAKFIAHCFFRHPKFDTDKWACSDKYCSSQKAKLWPKKCKICGAKENHTTEECTVDNHRAARRRNINQEEYFSCLLPFTRGPCIALDDEEYLKAQRAKYAKMDEYLRAEYAKYSTPMFM